MEQCNHLCNECDGVFHKSALKRSHIRIPVLHEGFDNDFQFHTVLPPPHPHKVRRFSPRNKASDFLIEPISTPLRDVLTATNTLVSYEVHSEVLPKPQDDPVVSVKLYLLGESLMCHFIAALRGLMDDRKVGYLVFVLSF